MITEYFLGALPSKQDVRDYSVKVVNAVDLPANFKQSIGENYNQTAGNCVMQTYRNIMRSIFGIEFGVNMGYGGFRSHNTQGLFPSEAATNLCKCGIAPLSSDGGELEVQAVIDYYNANKDKLLKAASPYKGLTWGRASSAAEIKQALYNGLFVAGCFAISQMYTSEKGIFHCSSAIYGYHEMRIFGWKVIDGVEYACVQNSWGTNWGENGECYISWEDVLRVGDIIVFTAPSANPDNTVIRRTLRKGMKGDDVQKMQSKLIDLGYNLGRWGADGSFGNATYIALQIFQKMYGLKPDGICGPKTWKLINDEK